MTTTMITILLLEIQECVVANEDHTAGSTVSERGWSLRLVARGNNSSTTSSTNTSMGIRHMLSPFLFVSLKNLRAHFCVLAAAVATTVRDTSSRHVCHEA
uniref:Secreted protein n=1 Tax=Lotharella oceanica TaxID=641309 RepID=A0A7S2XDU9_9EUKA|mmetsp:Transcript_33549/g.62364  ORF Transcript_33549/g.62364 Transcript_33549/m.62364 type:complete len:100 (+) Transcript_33549:96-395(+)